MKLCNPKSRVLSKEDAGKPVFRDDERIRVNEKFENNNIRIKLTPQIKADKLMEGAGGNKSVNEIDKNVI